MNTNQLIKDLEKMKVNLDKTVANFPLLQVFTPMKVVRSVLDNMIDSLKTKEALEI